MTAPHTLTQVLVVGAGPVGLLLAGDLAQYGVRVVLADTLAEPMTESRASQLNARTMEILGQRGLVDAFEGLVPEPAGHFGGLAFDATTTPSRYAGNWKVPQFRTEAVLAERARAQGADLCREHRLVGLDVTDGGVLAHFHTPAGPRTVQAGHLVGCDGADSAVRSLAGFELTGTAAVRELLRADVTGIEIPDRRFARSAHGFAASARRPDGVTRIMVHAFGRPPVARTGPPEFTEIAEVWRTVTGEDVSGATAIWRDAFDDACAQATAYQRGPVLIAGDAAHVHMPVGGQALNLGLQDAANLGWKLAAQVHGWAPPGLLDSYHQERHPAGKRVMDNVQAQGMLLFGGAEMDPVRQLFGELLARTSLHHLFAGPVGGLDVRYDVGADSSPYLGARLPDLPLTADGTRTTAHRLLGEGRGVLLDLTGGRATANAAAREWSGRVRVVHAEAAGDLDHGAVFLVRPDAHVVWTDTGATPLRDALRRWFGEADASAARP
ncbi:FAD-dependent monooxygenase [Streptomyces purpureus]|uniref:Oxygenase n=1 Tax=Streptomyces purpureus TaxID=1951 RepID=A0A918LMK5_9ACTN|nr:FAD-dependent monooxygenase [Streptomyces purpureus]GGT19268.1 putative oxygenase [Streptomyces purpureus]